MIQYFTVVSFRYSNKLMYCTEMCFVESSQSDAEEDTVVFARDTGERVAPQRRRFMRYETDEGESYYVEVGTQNSTWDLPPDGEVVART